MNRRDTVLARGVTTLRSMRLWVLLAMLSLITAAAGQSSDLPRVGWVLSGTPENSRYLIEAMRAGLADEGLADGRNVVLDVRYAAGREKRPAAPGPAARDECGAFAERRQLDVDTIFNLRKAAGGDRLFMAAKD